MSATRREYIGLSVNGQHVKPEVHCVNGGVGGGVRKTKGNRETIFLFGVILAQTACMVAGFIVFGYYVDTHITRLSNELGSRPNLSERINSLSGELRSWSHLSQEMEVLRRELESQQQLSHRMDIMDGELEVLKKYLVARSNQTGQLDSPVRLSERIDSLSSELELLKNLARSNRTVDADSQLLSSERINISSSEHELLKKSQAVKPTRAMPRGAFMPPLHGKSEVMKVVTVETVEEYPEIESIRDEKEYDSSEEDEEPEEDAESSDNAQIFINGNSGAAPTNLNADISRLRDHQAQHRPDSQRNLEQPLTPSSPNRNASSPAASHGNLHTLLESNNDDSDEDDGKQTADNTEISVNPSSGSVPTLPHSKYVSLVQDQAARHRPVAENNSEKLHNVMKMPARNTSSQPRPSRSHSQTNLESANLNHDVQSDEHPKSPIRTAKHEPLREIEMLQKNTNREEGTDTRRSRIARAAPEKRHVNQVQDSGQPRMNSIIPTVHSLALESDKGPSSAAIPERPNPAAHFNSIDRSYQVKPSAADDCPREIQNNPNKWAPSEVPGSEHFDLKNNESITVRKEGLYFVYSQIYFYKDRSIFGYLIKRENQAVLQCSIHTPTNRTSNGSGTTCYTAGLVYLRANDVLRLEIFNESGKCVRWGPGKSFIGLFRLSQDLNLV